MPLFEYKAVAPTGETVQGTMEAASVDAVVLKLQEAGNVPLQARESGGGFSLGGFSIGRRSMNAREVGEFTQQLATLLGAGPAVPTFTRRSSSISPLSVTSSSNRARFCATAGLRPRSPTPSCRATYTGWPTPLWISACRKATA